MRPGRELCCSASPSSDEPRTPSSLASCCTRSWWLRWPSIWTSSRPPSIPRSTTTNPTRACGSDDAAFEAAALTLGQTAPDAEALVVCQGVVEALVTDLATQADLLGLTGGAALLREEGLRIRLRAERTVLPLVRV